MQGQGGRNETAEGRRVYSSMLVECSLLHRVPSDIMTSMCYEGMSGVLRGKRLMLNCF